MAAGGRAVTRTHPRELRHNWVTHSVCVAIPLGAARYCLNGAVRFYRNCSFILELSKVYLLLNRRTMRVALSYRRSQAALFELPVRKLSSSSLVERRETTWHAGQHISVGLTTTYPLMQRVRSACSVASARLETQRTQLKWIKG